VPDDASHAAARGIWEKNLLGTAREKPGAFSEILIAAVRARARPPALLPIVPYNSEKVFLFYSEIAFQGDAVDTALSIRAVEGLGIRPTYFPRFSATAAGEICARARARFQAS